MRPWFLDRFESVTPAGDEKWRMVCTRCGSRRALTIYPGRDRWIAHCYAGCRPYDVLAIADLRFDDLLFESESAAVVSVREHLRGSRDVSRHPSLHKDDDGPGIGEVEHLLRQAAAGEIEPIPVRLPPLPQPVTPALRRVADFYRLVRGVRLWAGDDRDVLFASDWVAGQIGLHPTTVWRQIVALCEAGVLVHVDTRPGRGKRGPRTYLPGPLVGGDEQRDELLGAEAAVEADAPDVEPRRVQPAREPSDVVAVLEAPLVVGGLDTPVRGAPLLAGADVKAPAQSPADVIAVAHDEDRRPATSGLHNPTTPADDAGEIRST